MQNRKESGFLTNLSFCCRFLTKLLTQDLPLLFVRPNKSVVNFLQGKAVGPLSRDFKDGIVLNGFAGELSVTLIEARDLTYFPLGKVLSFHCCEHILSFSPFKGHHFFWVCFGYESGGELIFTVEY
jgi:hypothetical protein